MTQTKSQSELSSFGSLSGSDFDTSFLFVTLSYYLSYDLEPYDLNHKS
jgi:hypothetical protein